MIRHGWSLGTLLIPAAFLAPGLTPGCNQPLPGSSMSLGTADYAAAFAAAREVMAQYYPVESANPDTGVIQCRPKLVEEARERILGGSQARHLASLRIRKEGAEVVAYASVAVQRQGGAVLRHMRPAMEDYDSVPNKSPAEGEAATTAEQNESWRTHRYAADVERKILQDLRLAVNPPAKP